MKKRVLLAALAVTTVVVGASMLIPDRNTFGALLRADGPRTAVLPAQVLADAMPEPATMLLFGLGLLCFAAIARRRGTRV